MNEIKTIPTTGNRELMLVIPPDYSYDIEIKENMLNDWVLVFLPNTPQIAYEGEQLDGSFDVFTFSKNKYKNLQLLGTISGNYECDFDVEPFVEVVNEGGDYRDYSHNGIIGVTTPEHSFKTLLNANDHWLHNHIGERPQTWTNTFWFVNTKDHTTHFNEKLYMEALNAWQEAQNKVVSKFVVLLKS